MDLVEEIENRLKKGFAHAEISIDFHDGKHMSLEVESAEFKGMGLLEQHRKVYECVQDLIDDGYLHALKLKTKAK